MTRTIIVTAVALLATVTTVHAGQALAVLEESSAFESPSDSAQAKPDKAKKGDAYVLLQTQGEWYQVQFDEKPAWLKKGKQPGQQQGGQQGGAQGGGQQGQSGKNNLEVKQGVALKRVIAASLNVRTSPGMTGGIIGTLPAGTMVVERGGTGEWRQISFRGQTAYVYGDYLEAESGAKPTSSEVNSTPTGRSQSPSAGALPGGGGSSGLGSPSNQQGSAVQKSPFQDLLSMLTGGGNDNSNTAGTTPTSDTSTPSPTPSTTSDPPAPVIPGTPEVPPPSSTSGTSTPGTSTTGTSTTGTSTTGTSTPSDSMWDDAPDSASASSTPTTTSSGTPSESEISPVPGSGTTSDPGSGTPEGAAPGESSSAANGAGGGGSAGVGYAEKEGSSDADAKKEGGEEKDGKKSKTEKDDGTEAKTDGEAPPADLPATETEAAPEELVLSEEDLELVARVVQGEAIQCAHETRVAVAAVILNRLRSPSFPDTVKRVVQQRLQFPSYATEVRAQLLEQPLDETCLDAAREAANGFDPTDGATHFYNPHLGEKPAWVKKMDKTVRFGDRPDDTLEFYRPKPTAAAAPAPTTSMFDE